MSAHCDFLPEGTQRGLPGPLPTGERILWQGAPSTRGLWLRVFHAPLAGLWFAVCGIGVVAVAQNPAGTAAALAGVLGLALALLGVLAFAAHRTTLYTVTNRRLVLQIGIALPVTYNLPFGQVESAELRLFGDGSGDVPLRLKPAARIAYLQLWPHARPWRVGRPEPMLRSVPGATEAAAILGRALAEARDAEVRAAAPGIVADLPVIVARPGRAAPGRLVAAE
ncbi:photosynthetic complex putative assembly protein PuhB [Methylobacterium hispanicum]|uniref:photosynthetic complex putative assembly protein PuhB n=1 Tax=Methylobacterium hispanicum TaxID=270350 RepID=UPI002F2FAD88